MVFISAICRIGTTCRALPNSANYGSICSSCAVSPARRDSFTASDGSGSDRSRDRQGGSLIRQGGFLGVVHHQPIPPAFALFQLQAELLLHRLEDGWAVSRF